MSTASNPMISYLPWVTRGPPFTHSWPVFCPGLQTCSPTPGFSVKRAALEGLSWTVPATPGLSPRPTAATQWTPRTTALAVSQLACEGCVLGALRARLHGPGQQVCKCLLAERGAGAGCRPSGPVSLLLLHSCSHPRGASWTMLAPAWEDGNQGVGGSSCTWL